MSTTATKVFLSHDSKEVALAINRIDQLKKDGKGAFLSSDWKSLKTGGFWFQEIILALQECQEFEALVFKPDDFRNLWMSFELGVAMGAAAKASRSDAQIIADIRVVCGDKNHQPPDQRICPIGI